MGERELCLLVRFFFDLLVEARVHHPRPPLAVARIVGVARRLILAMHLVDLAPSMMKGEWWGVGGEFAVVI